MRSEYGTRNTGELVRPKGEMMGDNFEAVLPSRRDSRWAQASDAPSPSVVGQRGTSSRSAIDQTWSWLLARAEIVYVVAALFLFMDALIPLLLMGPGEVGFVDEARAEGGQPLLKAMFLMLQMIAALLVLKRLKPFLRTASNHVLTLLLVAFALASAAWSVEPELTFRRGLALLGTTGFGLYLSARYSPETILRLLAWALGMVVALSLLFGVTLPHLGIHSGVHDGAWRGIFTHKNTLGPITALSAVVFMLVFRSAHRHRWVGLIGVVLSCALLLCSKSATALSILCILVLLWPLYSMLRWRVTLMVPVLIGAVLIGGGAASLLVANREAAFGALGRDPTLTGRTDMWALIGEAVQQRPWLGHGYKAFWRDEQGPRAGIWRALEWQPTSAHNGIVELSLDLGLIGAALFLAGFIVAAYLAVRALRTNHEPVAYWPLLYLTFLLLLNITESAILQQNSIYWILYVAIVSSALLRETGAGTAAGQRIRPESRSPILGETPSLHGTPMPGSAPLSPAIRWRSFSRTPSLPRGTPP